MKITAEPRSDQLNADDFLAGPGTYTITGVRAGTAEQKYDVLLEGEERVWRPPLTVLRVLIGLWGNDSTTWVGRAVTLYLDKSVRFGKEQVGGIRLSHATHIDKPTTVSVTTARGRRSPVTVHPLDPRTVRLAALRTEWDTADETRRTEITHEVTQLQKDTP